MPLNAEQRKLRAQIAAYAMHAQGKTNTQAALDALQRRFEDEVDPDRTLDPEVRAKRVKAARKRYYAQLRFRALKDGAA